MKRLICCGVIAAALMIAPSMVAASDPNLDAMAQQTTSSEQKTGTEFETRSGYDAPAMLPAASFLIDGGDPNQYYFSFGGGYLYGRNGGTCMLAPLRLPVGAEITSMYINYIDDYTGSMNVQLRRKDVRNTDVTVILAQVATTGDDANVSTSLTSAITNPIVENQYFTYFVNFCLPDTSEIKFFNARVYYIDG